MQSELNKKLIEAIEVNIVLAPKANWNDIEAAASACEKIVLQEKIDLLNELENTPDAHIKSLLISTFKKYFTEQLK